MGGRLDATNVVEPVLSIISDIALDHQKYLGSTITEISREKAGIIRPGGAVVTLPQHPEANEVVGNTIAELGARAVSAVPYVPAVAPGARDVAGIAPNGGDTRYPLRVMGDEILVDSPLIGRHQLRNIALAIAAAEELNRLGFPVTAGEIERGIRETFWPGRFQRIAATADSPEIVLDVAHNPAGAWALRSTLSEHAGERPLVLVFGVMRDKAIGEIAEILFPLAERVIATRAENPRSASPEEISAAAAHTGVEVEKSATVVQALAHAREITPAQGTIVVTGSIYVVGEALTVIGVSEDLVPNREVSYT
jgi:dihydrofolate synthase/folylpolyglutamate synthase